MNRLRLLLTLIATSASTNVLAAQVTDGSCVVSTEPALSALGGIVREASALATPRPMSLDELAERDARAAWQFRSESLIEERSILDHSTLVVPGSYQGGGTCAFRAMRMVSLFWRSIGHDATAIPVDDHSGKAAQGDAIAYARDVLGVRDAQQNGITLEDAAKVARHYGFDARHTTDTKFDQLRAAIRAGTPPIVGFYVGDDGRPTGKLQRDAAGNVVPRFHAGVIEGIDEERGLVHVKHAWNRNRPFIVRIEEFERSWAHGNREMLVMTPGGSP